jgi:hypothetical protein
MEGRGPDEMFFPMKWVEVSGRAEDFWDTGGWMINPQLVRADLRVVVLE